MTLLAIASTSRREALRQPVCIIVIIVAALLIYTSRYFAFFAFGEEVSMIREMSLATILLSGLLLAVFSASTVLGDEIERKTVLTLLSKPVRRVELVIGKYLGIIAAVFIAFIPLTLVFLLSVWWAELELPKEWTWADVRVDAAAFAVGPAILLLKSVVLTFLEVMVLAAVSLALSTYLPMVVNMIVCVCVFVLGHQINYLLGFFCPLNEQGEHRIEALTSMGLFEALAHHPKFGIARLIATLLPNLENFNVGTAVSAGLPIPNDYLFATLAYGLIYTTIVLAVASLAFSRREVG